MALAALKNNFVSKAVAAGLVATAAVTPLSSSFAQQAEVRPVAQTTLSQEQLNRLEVEGAAFDYAYAHPGHIGVSVLRGPDAGSRQASELADGLERGIERRYGIQTEGYAGDNGNKPTEVTFHYLMVDTDNRPLVRSAGPYNMGDAIRVVPEVASAVRSTANYASLAYAPSND